MALLVSAKNSGVSDLPTAFRQIENWANVVRWQALPLNLALVQNYTPTVGAGETQAAFTPEPDGFVCIRGLVAFLAGVTGGTSYHIASIPAPLAPMNNEFFSCVVGNGTTIVAGRLEVDSNGAINVIPSSTFAGANTYISFSGARWTTF